MPTASGYLKRYETAIQALKNSDLKRRSNNELPEFIIVMVLEGREGYVSMGVVSRKMCDNQKEGVGVGS